MVTYNAIIQKEEDMYIATCPEVGTVSQGYTIEEAIENLKEFTVEAPKHSLLTTFEVKRIVKT